MTWTEIVLSSRHQRVLGVTLLRTTALRCFCPSSSCFPKAAHTCYVLLHVGYVSCYVSATYPATCRHGSNAGHSSGVAGVDARGATPPDPRLARWGLARCCQLDPSQPALLTREDPGVEPCLIPCGSSWSLSRLPAWPVLRSPLLERPAIGSALHA